MKYDPVEISRQFAYVREAQSLGQNRGARVEAVQHWALGTFGDSWCCESSVGLVLDICFQGESPFPRTTEINASTVDALAYARAQGWEVSYEESVPGDLVFSVHPDGTPHHVAIETQNAPLIAIAGNTSSDGQSSNGDGWYEHAVEPAGKVFVHYPRELAT